MFKGLLVILLLFSQKLSRVRITRLSLSHTIPLSLFTKSTIFPESNHFFQPNPAASSDLDISANPCCSILPLLLEIWVKLLCSLIFSVSLVAVTLRNFSNSSLFSLSFLCYAAKSPWLYIRLMVIACLESRQWFLIINDKYVFNCG